MITPEAIRREIDAILASFGASKSLLPAADASGKLYEAFVLGRVLQGLSDFEGFRFKFVNGPKLVLKSSPGPINRAYPSFEGTDGSRKIAIWTDVEFATFSYAQRGGGGTPRGGDMHELDIVVVGHDVEGYPAHHEVLWGVECKHTRFQKSMARGALGVRRELSLLTDAEPTYFRTWPEVRVPAQPPSVVSVYSTSPAVLNYLDAGRVFGIDFVHEPLP